MAPNTPLYVADTLPRFYPKFFERFRASVRQLGQDLQLLPGTKDVWARDYMPVASASGKHIRFRYFPAYLRNSAANRATISDADTICKAIGMSPVVSDIILDGGNVLIFGKKALLTERIFADNPQVPKAALCEEISRLLETEELILLPEWPGDFTGHADGMVQFVDEQTVLVSDYSREPEAFQRAMNAALGRHGLQTITLPYHPYRSKTSFDATGVYINYLKMQDYIFFPAFGLPDDRRALSTIQEVFPSCHIIPVAAIDIARGGGVFHCISWTK